MATTSATPARKAVLAALTTVTGQPRCLPTESLFARSATATATERAIAAKAKKRCFVIFGDPRFDGDQLVPGTLITIDYTVQVVCAYSAGSDLFNVESDRALELIETDERLVPAALTSPGALRLDPTGAATGLAGDALRLDGYRCVGPVPPRGDKGDRVLTVTHFFTASIDITQPT